MEVLKIFNSDIINLIHDFLGTQKNIKIYYYMHVVPYLDVKIRYIPVVNFICQYCYIQAIMNDTKYGICDFCNGTYNNKFRPISFEKFKKITNNKVWKILSNYDYNLFELAIKNKPKYINHNKSRIKYEIKEKLNII